MKKLCSAAIISGFVLCYYSVNAQEKDTISGSTWQHSIESDFYIWRDDFIFLPIYKADKDWLHLEARYNYEDLNTFSAWAGYNFSGGKSFKWAITPMVGVLVGNMNGLAPGLEFSLDFHRFSLYSESEYAVSFQDRIHDFYYNWTDIMFSPVDWLWFGLSAQRTKLYHSELEIQKGFFVGGGYRWLGLSAYFYNIHTDDPYLILSLTFDFPGDY